MRLFRLFIFYYLPVFLWAGVIFYFSSIPSLKTDFDSLWDFILRKTAHLTEFAILSVLIFRMLWRTARGWKGLLKESARFKIYFKVILLVCLILNVLYAISDEFHQSFVIGRTSSLRDVGIDSIGIAIGILFYALKTKKELRIIT